MKHITDPTELEVGREYWLVDKSLGTASVSTCQQDSGGRSTYFENYIWAEYNNKQGNNQAMKRWDIFGPLPVRIAPDFKALMAEKLSNPKVHDCLFVQRANTVS